MDNSRSLMTFHGAPSDLTMFSSAASSSPNGLQGVNQICTCHCVYNALLHDLDIAQPSPLGGMGRELQATITHVENKALIKNVTKVDLSWPETMHR